MGRIFPVLAACLLGGCDLLFDALVDAALYNTHDVLVHNQGDEAVRVHVSWNEDLEEATIDPVTGVYTTTERVTSAFDLGPGERGRESVFRWEPLCVRVVRRSDGLVLYEESLGSADFDEEHGTVEVVVFP